MTGFVARCAAWFVALLALWFLVAPWLAIPVGALAGGAMRQCFPGWVEAVERSGTTYALLTSLPVASEGGRIGALTLETSYLRFGYGLPLLPALLLASRARRAPLKAGAGILVLMPFQAWGVVFEWLQQALFTGGPLAVQRLGFAGWQVEIVALGYQLGSLAWPTLAPVLLWLALDRRFTASLFLSGWLAGAEGTRRPPAA